MGIQYSALSLLLVDICLSHVKSQLQTELIINM